ncbi:MAG: hypothetical protein N3A38_12780 [Planctomycetota bacterium]|nr:hypothetical protein [Planctomycetota bacterium]
MPKMSPHVDESALTPVLIEAPDDALIFENTKEIPVKRDALARFLDAMNNRELIRRMDIRETSTLESPWIVEWFPNLESLTIESVHMVSMEGLDRWRNPKGLTIDTFGGGKRDIRGIERIGLKSLEIAIEKSADIDVLRQCRSIKGLWLRRWPLRDLSAISDMALTRFSAVQGALRSLDGLPSAADAFVGVAICRFLANVGGIKAKWLRIESCNRVELESIAEVSGLAVLELVHQKNISSLRFLDKCVGLERLYLICDIPLDDLDRLLGLPALRKIFLATRGRKSNMAVKRLAEKAGSRDLVIMDLNVCFEKGKQVARDLHAMDPDPYVPD